MASGYMPPMPGITLKGGAATGGSFKPQHDLCPGGGAPHPPGPSHLPTLFLAGGDGLG